MSSPASRSGATAGQSAYLRSLAVQTGATFSPPHSRREASREIARLRELRERRGIHCETPGEVDPREQPYGTEVKPDEVSGFGSTASWRTGDAETVSPPRPAVGDLTELARYEVSSGARVIYGQRIDGAVRITDRPAGDAGRSYLVEREVERDGYEALKALVADYIEQARQLDDVPMASSVVRRQLEQIAADA